MKKNHRLAIDDKASCIGLGSPSVTSTSQPGKSQHLRLRGFAIAVAILIVPILTLYKIPAAADAPQHKSRDGATGPWEKTAGPPGLQTNVIFEANNIVYAGTETQGVYKSIDNGSH
jgi:hypothetical protein